MECEIVGYDCEPGPRIIVFRNEYFVNEDPNVLQVSRMVNFANRTKGRLFFCNRQCQRKGAMTTKWHIHMYVKYGGPVEDIQTIANRIFDSELQCIGWKQGQPDIIWSLLSRCTEIR